jgi:hypothetical protein
MRFFLQHSLRYWLALNALCGIDVIRAGKENVDDRFIPLLPEHVKFALLRAFPDVGWKVTKDEGFHPRGEKDMGLTQVLAHNNSDEGVKGRNNGVGALGKWTVDIREATQDGVHGSQQRQEDYLENNITPSDLFHMLW